MNNSDYVRKLADDLRDLVSTGRLDHEEAIERYLRTELHRYDAGGRLGILREVAKEFGGVSDHAVEEAKEEEMGGEMRRLISRFLGVSDGADRLSPRELADRFAGSLDTLFTSVNQLVAVINTTLLGQQQELETIRKVIDSNLRGDTDYAAIRRYLDRIQKAFLIAHTSFQSAASTVVEEVMKELDPEAIESATPAGFRIGPLRKADLFDQYRDRYARCRRWFDSPEFSTRLLREFEKNCDRLLTAQAR